MAISHRVEYSLEITLPYKTCTLLINESPVLIKERKVETRTFLLKS